MSKYTTDKNLNSNIQKEKDEFFLRFNELFIILGISQNEFARQIGSTSAFISNIATGKAKPGLEFLQKIAIHFGVSLDWLVLGKGTPHGKTFIDSDWYHTVRLRIELAKLASNRDEEAKKLVNELLDKDLDTKNKTGQRHQLIDKLAYATVDDSMLVMLYNLYSSAPDKQQRARDVLTEAIDQFGKNKSQDPLAQLVKANCELESLLEKSEKQYITGSGHRVAGRDYHEK